MNEAGESIAELTMIDCEFTHNEDSVQVEVLVDVVRAGVSRVCVW